MYLFLSLLFRFHSLDDTSKVLLIDWNLDFLTSILHKLEKRKGTHIFLSSDIYFVGEESNSVPPFSDFFEITLISFHILNFLSSSVNADSFRGYLASVPAFSLQVPKTQKVLYVGCFFSVPPEKGVTWTSPEINEQAQRTYAGTILLI